MLCYVGINSANFGIRSATQRSIQLCWSLARQQTLQTLQSQHVTPLKAFNPQLDAKWLFNTSAAITTIALFTISIVMSITFENMAN